MSERRVLAHLARQGFETYAPTIKQGGRTLFMFPRYVFVKIVDTWCAITGTYGVSSVIVMNGKIAVLSEDVITELREREAFGQRVLPVAPLKIGDRVRAKSGKWNNFPCVYDGMDSKQREYVLLTFLGRTNRIRAQGSLEAA